MEHTADNTMIPDEKSCAEALTRDQPLLPYQTYYLDYQLYAPSKCMVNMAYNLKLPKRMVEPEALKNAVNLLLHRLSVFGTVFTYNDAGELVQRYCPELIRDAELERTTEEDYRRIYHPELIKPHEKLNHLMYRIKLYETEENTYFCYDICHVLFDGTANRILLKLLFDVLHGGDIPQDRYYYYLEQMAKRRENADAKKDFAFLERLYSDPRYDKHPSRDVFDRGNLAYNEFLPTKHTLSEYEEAAKKKNTSLNKAFVCAALLAIRRFNQKDQVAVEWLYHGRNEEWKKQIAGLTMCAIPAAVDFSQINSTDELLAAVQEQVDIGYQYAEYSYALHQSSPSANEYFRVIYQKNISANKDMPAGVELEQNYDAINGLPSMMQAVIYPGEKNEPLSVILAVNLSCYTEERTRQFGKLFLEAFDECLLS